MHISEGVLSPAVLAGGAALAAAGTAIGLKKMDYEAIPRVAILSAAFFVATLIHVPVGPVGLHLVLNGLMGLLLGWLAVPAILIALFLQALLFQFGGLTVLGVNTVTMALPAVICFYVFRPFLRRHWSRCQGRGFCLRLYGHFAERPAGGRSLALQRPGLFAGGRTGSPGPYPGNGH